ncbi:hypothetical protein VMCG_04269 [Cytospora schulzeri]|uniref:Uncharacterized protein n=1 Tax=Cytospora schulzeri TaxID=448051 RepID=A0A423WT44_9PEZI|nr:hypothetical protein VMCG_04269 [Valsa malicola]
MFQGDGRRELVHRVYKVKFTEDFLSEDSQLKKRAKDQCPTSYSLCPSSLGGDCCPDGYACAKESCYATTAAGEDAARKVREITHATLRKETLAIALDEISTNVKVTRPGLVCGAARACNNAAGATYSQTCPTGYYLCPASANYGCCQSGMGCGVSACYSTSPSTSVIVIATTTDGSATTITSTTVVTPTGGSSDSAATDAGAAAKVFPSTYAKAAATESSDNDSSGSSDKGGLTTGEVGGIIGGAVALLLIVLAASFYIVKHLRRTERAVQSQRETTSGSGTRQTTDKKSATQVSVARVQPTPSEVDAMDYDPLMMSPSVASPRGSNQPPRTVNGRSRSGSDALSQPSGYSSSAAAARWNTPSVDSDGDSIARGYFGLPPRVHNHPGGRPPMRSSQDSSQYSYRHAYQNHGRQYSNASELSAGSDSDVRSQHGMGSPLIPPTAIELGVDGGFVPELPGSDTETESIGPHRTGSRQSARRPRRSSTGVSMSNIVSPVSMTTVNRPQSTHTNTGRRRGSSVVSPLEGQGGNGTRARNDSSVLSEPRLGSIDESTTGAGAGAAPTPDSMHGFFGSPTTAVGHTVTGPRNRTDVSSSTLPGFVPVWNPGDQMPIDHWDDEKQQR